MRVLATWIFFDQTEITGDRNFRRPRGRGEEPEPGIGVGWFAGDTTTLMSPIHNLKIFQPLHGRRRQEEALSEELLRTCVDLLLIDAPEFEFDATERSIQNPEIVDYILSQPVVIERSPPFTITLKGLLNSTNLPVWIGTYMGWSVAPEHSVFLFITIPGGIIVVSSAAGLANALSAGLNKSVKRLFSPK